MVARFTGQSHGVVQLDTGLVDDDHVGRGGSHRTRDGCRQILPIVLFNVFEVHPHIKVTSRSIKSLQGQVYCYKPCKKVIIIKPANRYLLFHQ